MEIVKGPKPELQKIDYSRTNGKVTEDKKAWIIPIDINQEVLESLPLDELNALIHISRAVNGISPITAAQLDPSFLPTNRALLELLDRLENPDERKALQDYLTIVNGANRLHDHFGSSIVFPLPKSSIPADLMPRLVNLWQYKKPNPGRGFYPEGTTLEEIRALNNWDAVNSTVVTNEQGRLEVVLNEQRFANEIVPVIEDLRAAYRSTNSPTLEDYLEAKLVELHFGGKEHLTESEKAWIGNRSELDFIIGTGVEKYEDKIARVRGTAQALVGVVNHKYDTLLSKVTEMMPEWETKAPWKHKKWEKNLERIPITKCIEIVNWAGNYNGFPFITVAESLPNDKQVADEYGTVNLMFTNIIDAVMQTRGTELADRFFRRRDVKELIPLMGDAYLLTIILHELGHTTGGFELSESPDDYFGKHGVRYSEFEEARATLFALWAINELAEQGSITEELKMAAYYEELSSWVYSLKLPPEDHSGAANHSFHYFLDKGAIREIKHRTAGKRRSRFVIEPDKWVETTAGLVGRLTDWKAVGAYDKTEAYLNKYIRCSRAHWVDKATSDLPLGRLLIFPQLSYRAGILKLDWPEDFLDQPRTMAYKVRRSQL